MSLFAFSPASLRPVWNAHIFLFKRVPLTRCGHLPRRRGTISRIFPWCSFMGSLLSLPLRSRTAYSRFRAHLAENQRLQEAAPQGAVLSALRFFRPGAEGAGAAGSPKKARLFLQNFRCCVMIGLKCRSFRSIKGEVPGRLFFAEGNEKTPRKCL